MIVDSRPAVVALLGMPVHVITERGCVEHIVQALAGGSGGWVITPNLDLLHQFRRSADFREIFLQANLSVADGMPLVWASRVQGEPLPERVAGSHLIYSVAGGAAANGNSLFLLGGEPGIAEKTAEALRAKHPGLVIAGTCSPPFGFETDAAETEKIRAALARSAPDIVLLALGTPKQERFIVENRALLPRAWWLGLGGSFDMVAGKRRHAPRWMQRAGIEWIFRLALEPRRLARRYLARCLPAAFLLFADALRKRLRHPLSGGAPSRTGRR